MWGDYGKAEELIMNISKSLYYIRDIKNKNMASFVYKICKVIANIEAQYASCTGMVIN